MREQQDSEEVRKQKSNDSLDILLAKQQMEENWRFLVQNEECFVFIKINSKEILKGYIIYKKGRIQLLIFQSSLQNQYRLLITEHLLIVLILFQRLLYQLLRMLHPKVQCLDQLLRRLLMILMLFLQLLILHKLMQHIKRHQHIMLIMGLILYRKVAMSSNDGKRQILSSCETIENSENCSHLLIITYFSEPKNWLLEK